MTQTGTTRRSAVRISLAPHAVLLIPLRDHTGHEMHPRGFTTSQKTACKSRPGYLVSSAWYLWIVHECGILYRQKMDFSICDHKVGFPKYSHKYSFTNICCYTLTILYNLWYCIHVLFRIIWIISYLANFDYGFSLAEITFSPNLLKEALANYQIVN